MGLATTNLSSELTAKQNALLKTALRKMGLSGASTFNVVAKQRGTARQVIEGALQSAAKIQSGSGNN
jgi:hypothetical protein